MINNRSNLSKNERFNNPLNLLPAGIFTNDNSIEAFGIIENRKCVFYRNGKQLSLKQLPERLLIAIYNHMVNNNEAFKFLKKQFHCKYQQMEEYIFCMWGQSNHESDFKLVNKKWELSTPENFNCSNGGNCHCFTWQGKANRINGVILTSRDIYIIRQVYLNNLDTVIAIGMGIKISTYNTHKKTLFTKLNVTTRTELVALAIKNQIV